MKSDGRERRRVGLGVATLLSVLLHVLLSLFLAVVTLRRDRSGTDDASRPTRPEAKAEKTAGDYPLVVSREERERPVHEKPLEIAVAAPADSSEPRERPRPADRVAQQRPSEAEPVESLVAVELPRAAAAPRHSIDTPAKLARQSVADASSPSEDRPVQLPRSLVVKQADDRATGEPAPAPRADRPRRVAPTSAAARPATDATDPTDPEPRADLERRRAVARKAEIDTPTLAATVPAARAATTDAAEPDPRAESLPLLVAVADPVADAARLSASVSRPTRSGRADDPRPRTAAASRSRGSAAGDDGAPTAATLGSRRTMAAVNGTSESAFSDPAAPLPRAAGGAAAAGGGAGDLDATAESLAGLPTEPLEATGPPETAPSEPRPRAAASGRRAASRGQVRPRSQGGRGTAAAEESVAEEAFAALVGGRVRGLENASGTRDASETTERTPLPGRAAIEGGSTADGVVASLPEAEAGDAGKTVPADGGFDPFANVAAAAPARERPSRSGARAIVRSRAPEGAGGIEDEAGPQPGITARPNRRPTDSTLENDARFLARVAASALPVDGRVREMAPAFRQRSQERRDESRSGRPRPETEAAIERGLAFLARAQQPDGRWSLSRFPGATASDIGSIRSDTAATGLALLCFLGAGYDHFGETHADTVRRGLEFLRAVQRPDGDLYLGSDEVSNRSARLYSHAIAAMALCEAVGMTGDPLVKESARKACRFIELSQHEQRGGWRYTPGIGSDLSVSGWMLLALRSGQLAGIEVSPRCLQGVRVLLDTFQSPEEAHAYVYNPHAPDTPQQRAGRKPTPTMNAVGLLMRLHSGWNRDDPRIVRGAVALAAEPAAIGSRGAPKRDCYLWYYAAQVLFHVGGEPWDRWYEGLHALLVDSQEDSGDAAGSWDPGGTVPDRWGGFGGRIYVTALNILTLEVSYRHLPIYQVLAPPADPAP